jgi:hypothetical protein
VALQPLILEVYNNALAKGNTPKSWKDIRVRLLPKKGDLAGLKNWRPISLINCDAKAFTRVLNIRIAKVANQIIQPTQTGFIKGRFIGDNGLALHLLLQQARYRKYKGIGLLLDQEKAYDRVHPQYLIKVLEAFGFHPRFIHCIHSLFFGNSIQVNVNGFFSPSIEQQRGLRQGDPLSPILFNLALEPMLLAINQDSSITGYQCCHDSNAYNVKTLAYADDVCAILHNQDDYNRLQSHLNQFSKASNAKFNQSKIEAFSLNGNQDEGWKTFLQQYNISNYHTNRSPEPFRYLGFYMVYTTVQRDYIQDKLIATVNDQITRYSVNQISLRGRTTVINTLVMTKIWYVLRLFQPTQAFLQKMKSLMYNYVWRKKYPLVSYNQLCLPLVQEGLGLLMPATQHRILQVRHLRHLFSNSPISLLVQPLIRYHLSIITNSKTPVNLPFFVPELRNHAINHPTSIINACYKTFDQFDCQPDFSNSSIQTILQMPLHYMFTSIPGDHWLHRYSSLPAYRFLIYDASSQRLRIQVPGEYEGKPRLCNQLKKQVLEHRTMKLQPYLWKFIINDVTQEMLDRKDDPLLEQFQQVKLWQRYQPRLFRYTYDSKIQKAALLLPGKSLEHFWSNPMLLQARNLWYRVLSKNIPHTKYLYEIGKADSSICQLCQEQDDSSTHFLVSCPRKMEIWNRVLHQRFRTYEILAEDIINTLINLQPPFHHRSVLYMPFMVSVSTTLWYIWLNYWKCMIEHTPFLSENIVPKIQSQISILLAKHQLE